MSPANNRPPIQLFDAVKRRVNCARHRAYQSPYNNADSDADSPATLPSNSPIQVVQIVGVVVFRLIDQQPFQLSQQCGP
jgi:hypothetical protein